MEAECLRSKTKLKIQEKKMLEELKEPISSLEEDIKNVWGRL
jgi:hypothetical protein